jgi:hypothetical protein
LQSGSTALADEELKKVFLFDPENQKAAALMDKIRHCTNKILHLGLPPNHYSVK